MGSATEDATHSSYEDAVVTIIRGVEVLWRWRTRLEPLEDGVLPLALAREVDVDRADVLHGAQRVDESCL